MIEAYRTLRAMLVARRDKIDQTIALLDAAIAEIGDEPKDKPAKKRAPKANGNGHALDESKAERQAALALDALKEAGEVGMPSAALRQDLGLPPPEFKAVVGALIADGKIVKFGQRAGTGYRLA